MKEIQVYGLPRSGTNYLEYLIINNLEVKYDGLNGNSKSDYFYYPTQLSTKHCKPNINDADYFIIILKENENFYNSFNNWYKRYHTGTDKQGIFEIMNNAIVDYIQFYKDNEDNCIILFHEDLLNNEEQFINRVSNKFNILLKNNKFVKSKLKTDNSGGNGLLNYVYNYIPIKESPMSDEYNKIKELKIKLV